MIKKLSTATLALLLGAGSLYAGKGKIRVASDVQGAYVYVDGKKKAMTGEGFTSILLEEGEHSIRVEKIAPDERHLYVAKKKVFVGEDSSTKLSFKLKKKLTAKGRAYEAYKKERWVRNGSVVIDKELGLMWQDNSAAKKVKKKWKGAKRYCSNLTLAGHSDWRLPSYDELLSIVDYDRYDPAIMPSFENVASRDYWSSSQNVSDAKYAWNVYFKNGNTNNNTKSNEYHVRCVR
ncbi:MAG: DUF1566 domain-containing protein, partial [Sulfurovum sp.]|nr:DUF1566 domain-containing protein [Sulfurovum sp.]